MESLTPREVRLSSQRLPIRVRKVRRPRFPYGKDYRPRIHQSGCCLSSLRREVNKEVRAAASEKPAKERLPTETQLKAAERIGRLALDADLSVIRQQLISFALDYERIRATMPAGDERTRRMEVVTAKIRTLAIAGFPLIDEFSQSSSPGQRLLAVVMLQVKPDAQYLPWLAERLAVEKPFIGYHAAVALLTAARVLPVTDHQKILDAVRAAKLHLGIGKDTTDRMDILDAAEKELSGPAKRRK